MVARLKCVYYAWRFIDRVDGQLFVIWPKLPERYSEENVGYSPSQIFDLSNFYAAGGADRIQFLEGQCLFPESAVGLDGPAFAHRRPGSFELSDFADTDIVLSHRNRINYTYSDETADSPKVTGRVTELFRSLPIHPEIERVKEAFFERNGLTPKGYDAVHVRRGDVFDMWRAEMPSLLASTTTPERLNLIIGHYISRTAPLQFYHPAISEIVKAGRKIIFTSDTPEIITHFRREFGPEYFIDLSGLKMRNDIQKAFLDFLILADAGTIVGTSSNFSSFPAELGGATFVNVSGSGTEDSLVKSFELDFLEPMGVDFGHIGWLDERLRTEYRTLADRIAASQRARELKRARAVNA